LKALKFNEINEEQWDELRPYFDTCLLPLTCLTGLEQPPEVTKALEQLRDVMDCIEKPFKGRVVTYPAIQYSTNQTDFVTIVNEICENLKNSGFAFVILITAKAQIYEHQFEKADLLITAENAFSQKPALSELIENMWNPNL